MKKLLCGLAVLPLMTATALAQPTAHIGGLAQQPLLLTERQMDGVTAGFSDSETIISNTSWTRIEIYTGRSSSPPSTLPDPYLDIDSRAISIDSVILGGLS